MRQGWILVLLLLTSPASAQSAYVPVVLDEPTFNRIMEYLGEQPAKVAIPLINALTGLEASARKAKAEATVVPLPVEKTKK